MLPEALGFGSRNQRGTLAATPKGVDLKGPWGLFTSREALQPQDSEPSVTQNQNSFPRPCF